MRTAAFGLIFSALLQAQPAPVTLADYYRLETFASPAISPDGKRVAYVKTTIVEAENRRHSEIWLVPADASAAAVRVAGETGGATAPQWSPDGQLLAYTSAGKAHFLKMDAPGTPRVEIPGGVEGRPVFSPDNQWIAFTKRTPPPAKPAAELSEFDRQIEKRFKGRIYDWMNFRFDGRGYLPDPRDPVATPPQELYVVPRGGGVATQLTRLGVDVSGVAWSPDSQRLAFTANTHQRDEYAYERADLYTVTRDGRSLLRLSADDGHHHQNPAWSPDGRSIAVMREQGLALILKLKQRFGSPDDIALFSATVPGEPRNLTAAWDGMATAPRWSGDGQSIYFEAQDRGTAHLFRLTVATGDVQPVAKGDRVLSSFSMAETAGQVAYLGSDPNNPGTLFIAPFSGRATGAEKALTTPLTFQLGATERIRFDSKDGTSIDGWVVLPPGYSASKGKYPLILTSHGGPHGAYANNFAFQHQLLAAAGYIVVSTNPRASTGYGEKFRWGTWGAWGDRDMEDVMAGLDYALRHYSADPKRLGVTGYSYGGFLTNWLIGHTNRFAAAVVGAGPTNWISNYGTGDIPRTKETEFLGYPWEPEGNRTMIRQSPITYADKIATPTLFVHGEADHRVPIAQAEEMYTALKKRQVPAKFVRYPNTSHGGWSPWDTVHRYRQELLWWQQYLGSGPTPN